jgi:hypothetical protein
MNPAATQYTQNDHQTYRMNFLDESYVVFEGIMGSMPITYLMRFGASVEPGVVKQVVRELLSANPRLRSVVEPGKHRYHLRVLPDTEIIDEFLEVAWQVEPSVDTQDAQAVESLHWRLHNDLLPIERGLMCKFIWVPHAAEPILIMVLHHIVGDGVTSQHLTFEIVKRLNGGAPMAFQPIEAPPLWQVFGPPAWWQWPAAVWRSLAHERQTSAVLKAVKVSQLEMAQSPYMSSHGLQHFQVPVSASVLRQLARQWGVSLNALVVLAVAETFLAMAQSDPRSAAVIRQAMNVRKFYPAKHGYGPLWGNHVGVFLVVEQPGKTLQARAQSIKQQIEEQSRRYAQKEGFGRYAFMGMVLGLGRTLVAHILTGMLRRRKPPAVSCYITNVGSSNAANQPGYAVPLVQHIISVPCPTLMQAVTELNDVLHMPASWQRSEISPQAMHTYLTQLRRSFEQLAAQVA